MAKRGVPAGNVLGLNITLGQYYYSADYAKFQSEVVQPIKTKLTALGATNIDTILLCYGMPTLVYSGNWAQAVCLDNTLIGLNYWDSGSKGQISLNPGAEAVEKRVFLWGPGAADDRFAQAAAQAYAQGVKVTPPAAR